MEKKCAVEAPELEVERPARLHAVSVVAGQRQLASLAGCQGRRLKQVVSIVTVADKACLNNSVTLPFVGGRRCFGVLLPFGRSFCFLLLTYWAFEVLSDSPHFLSHHELLRPCIYPASITMWTSHLETIPCWGGARGEGFDAALPYSQC
jgi:hypothetical protein